MTPGELERGRLAYERKAWREAYEALQRADAEEPLGAEDLELLAVSAYLLARDDETAELLERAHHAHLAQGTTLRAVRASWWLGLIHMMRGELGPATGWFGRTQRLLEREADDAVEHGYLLLPLVFRHLAAGETDAALESARRAGEIGERGEDGDLVAMAAQLQSHVLVHAGRIAEGLAIADEAMVAATSRAQMPVVVGIVYCAVVLDCVKSYDVRRAQEWTDVLSRWCRDQPDLVAFTGRCLIHRAEIKQLRGEWEDALEEARRASDRLAQGFNRPATAQAFYRQGELHRLRGELAAAEKAYAAASRYGFEPLPGLPLLRLARGRPDAAGGAIRRALAEATEPSQRAALLPAAVEILLALGDRDAARTACDELDSLARDFGSVLLEATAAHARGALLLEEGDADTALASLRRASQRWEELAAPYEAARTRVLVADACRRLGDDETAAWELAAARDEFAALGARPDLERVDSLARGARDAHGLTARELEVLRLVAAGNSNRQIAAALVISEHTVARHLQNVFAKLDVSSRTAASAYAFEHGLV